MVEVETEVQQFSAVCVCARAFRQKQRVCGQVWVHTGGRWGGAGGAVGSLSTQTSLVEPGRSAARMASGSEESTAVD